MEWSSKMPDIRKENVYLHLGKVRMWMWREMSRCWVWRHRRRLPAMNCSSPAPSLTMHLAPAETVPNRPPSTRQQKG